MDTKDVIQTCVAFGALFVAAGSARVAIRTLKFNARTKSAEFLLTLHKAFFVEDQYKIVREKLDSDSPEDLAAQREYVTTEPAAFTDFLNFFELITFLSFTKTLKKKQVEALLGYYLDILWSKQHLREYIIEGNHGFEHLARFLKERDSRRRLSA